MNRCPIAVINSCRSPEQLYVADKYARLWMRRYGIHKKAASARKIWEALSLKLLDFPVALLVLLLLGCAPEDHEKNYRERLSKAEVFCLRLETKELRPYCVIGYMGSCSPQSCEVSRD